MDLSVMLGLLLGIPVACALATLWWCRRLWKQRSELPVWKRVVTGVVAGSALVGLLGILIGLVKGFGAVGGESSDPSQKARILAEGISEAMSCTALGAAVWLPSVIVLAIVTRRRATK